MSNLRFYPQERIALFIDGSNLYATARALAFDIDYKSLLGMFQKQAMMVRAFYYTALLDDQEYSPIRPLVDWLDYNGYTIVTKPTKSSPMPPGGRKIKGNMDIELAIDVMEMADRLDHIVLFSGDGDFRRLVEAVQRQRRTGDGDFYDQVLATDDRRRAAPAGGQLCRTDRIQEHISRPVSQRNTRQPADDMDLTAIWRR